VSLTRRQQRRKQSSRSSNLPKDTPRAGAHYLSAVRYLLTASPARLDLPMVDIGLLDRYERLSPLMNEYDQLLNNGGAVPTGAWFEIHRRRGGRPGGNLQVHFGKRQSPTDLK
jgi:hypothetical protein